MLDIFLCVSTTWSRKLYLCDCHDFASKKCFNWKLHPPLLQCCPGTVYRLALPARRGQFHCYLNAAQSIMLCSVSLRSNACLIFPIISSMISNQGQHFWMPFSSSSIRRVNLPTIPILKARHLGVLCFVCMLCVCMLGVVCLCYWVGWTVKLCFLEAQSHLLHVHVHVHQFLHFR